MGKRMFSYFSLLVLIIPSNLKKMYGCMYEVAG